MEQFKCTYFISYSALWYWVFEGVRAYQTKDGAAIFRLIDHTKRLFDAASKIGIMIPFSESELKSSSV